MAGSNLKKWLKTSDCPDCGGKRHRPVQGKDGSTSWVPCECLRAMELIDQLREAGLGNELIATDFRNTVSGNADSPVAEQAKARVRDAVATLSRREFPDRILVLVDDGLYRGMVHGAILLRSAMEAGFTRLFIDLARVHDEYMEDKGFLDKLRAPDFLCFVLGDEYRKDGAALFKGNLVYRVVMERDMAGSYTCFVSKYERDGLERRYGPDVMRLFSDQRYEFIPVG